MAEPGAPIGRVTINGETQHEQAVHALLQSIDDRLSRLLQIEEARFERETADREYLDLFKEAFAPSAPIDIENLQFWRSPSGGYGVTDPDGTQRPATPEETQAIDALRRSSRAKPRR